MDWTAITGIVVAGVVGPAVIGCLAIRRQEDQQEHERASDDLGDLRTLLAKAANDLQRAEGMLGGVLLLLLRHGGKLVTDESSVSYIDDVKATGQEVVLNDARIAIRLDDANPVADAHRGAVAALERAARAIGLVGGIGGANLSETNAELTAAQDALGDARKTFTRAARAEVGVAGARRGAARRRRSRRRRG